MDKHLHIITPEIPWPANYGGVMDLYHKIRLLHEEGVKIHLHCFAFHSRKLDELKKYCSSIRIYKRKKYPSWKHVFLPYIVSSRASQQIMENIKNDDYPVLIEGVHSSYPLYKGWLKGRKVFVRLHNVEFIYYRELARHEHNLFKRIYFLVESILLRRYEAKLAHMAPLFCVSKADREIYTKILSADKTEFLPVFTGFNQESIPGKGNYCLYHGNLSISENIKAVRWLLKEVFAKLQIPLVVAGRRPPASLVEEINEYPFGSVVANPSEEEMDELIRQAHINILPSFNNTGVKLKLIHALYTGRFCLVNEAAVRGSGLKELCTKAKEEATFRHCIRSLMKDEFTQEMIEKRRQKFLELYDNKQNVQLLIEWIY